jgi:hypothetical protein
MDNRAWIKVGKLDLSSTFPAPEFVANCHVALHTFHDCSSARMFATELTPGAPEIVDETAVTPVALLIPVKEQGSKNCAPRYAKDFRSGIEAFPRDDFDHVGRSSLSSRNRPRQFGQDGAGHAFAPRCRWAILAGSLRHT